MKSSEGCLGWERKVPWLVPLYSLFYVALNKVTGSHVGLAVETRVSPDEGVGNICPLELEEARERAQRVILHTLAGRRSSIASTT